MAVPLSLLDAWLAPPSDADFGKHPSPSSARHTSARHSSSAPTDDPLVSRIRTGDEAAFAEVVREYGDRLIRFAYRELHSHEAAEEIVQEVLANVWVHRAEWAVSHTVATYLFQSVRHRIHNARRSTRATIRRDARIAQEELARPASAMLQPNAAIEEGELRAALARALDMLPERPRQVFLLSREDRLTFREIAAVLDLSVRTVEHHMARAIALLRRELAEWLT